MATNDETRHKDADVLKRLYHKEKNSIQQVADELGVSHGTVRYWMDKHGIERRSRKEGLMISGGPPSMKVDEGGYENFTISQGGDICRIEVHRLLAVAEQGFDAVSGMEVHHKNGIPWDNRAENIELLTTKEHIAKHHNVTSDHVKLAAWSLYESSELTYREIAELFGEKTTNITSYVKYVRDGKTNPKIEV